MFGIYQQSGPSVGSYSSKFWGKQMVRAKVVGGYTTSGKPCEVNSRRIKFDLFVEKQLVDELGNEQHIVVAATAETVVGCPDPTEGQKENR